MKAIIHLDHVSKTFPVRRGMRDLRGRGGLGDVLLGKKEEKFTALHDISLEMYPGESLGIIGRNGSGKSTLLSLIAGVTLPSAGQVMVSGRVASLLELGAGFNPVLTGRENIYLNAGLLGMRHAQVDDVFDDIVRFSGIEEFIDQPVETYSSGMYVRIGFSVAAFVNPDIFLADEVLAVGDEDFQRKCRAKIGEFREQGKTIIFVSHDLGIVNTLCERVILLDRGRSIQRETPQKTITYYLRQVGRDKGVHTFSAGDLEAIHCDGRISLFHGQEEVSAPAGFRMQIESMGRRHGSAEADWSIPEKSDIGCCASGKMMRLPIRLVWDMRIENGEWIWRIAMEVENECAINGIDVEFFLPIAYSSWVCGNLSGTFPDIRPCDMQWNVVAAPETSQGGTAALPGPDMPLPPMLFQFKKLNPYFGFFWANTEYVTGSRVLNMSARFPDAQRPFSKGMHPLLEVKLDMSQSAASILDHLSERNTLDCGSLKACFEHGQVRLSWEDKPLTEYLHLYSSMLIAHLWNDSQNLFWGDPESTSDGIRITGESRRFPFAQEWELGCQDKALGIRVWLLVKEEMEVQEYHLSLLLSSAYEHWRTDHEAGSFPEFVPELSYWTHLNHIYAPGAEITAFSKNLPTMFLRMDDPGLLLRQTVLNTSFKENARVLQALCPSEKTRLRFPPGRHLYFSGSIGFKDDAMLETDDRTRKE